MWGKVSCLRKQHDGRDWASNHRLSDLKSNTLTTAPPRYQKVPNFKNFTRKGNTGRRLSLSQCQKAKNYLLFSFLQWRE